MGIVEDSLGRVWIVAATADPKWASALEEMRRSDGRPAQRVADYHRYYDTVLQVIDPRSGSLIASQRFDPYLTLVLDAAHLAGDVEDEGGVPRVRVWRMQLHTSP
jgi:hypothetical protein